MINVYMILKRLENLEALCDAQQQQIDRLLAEAPKREAIKRFVPPTTEEVIDEVRGKISHAGAVAFAEKFIAHYESNGWLVGRNKMKNWKAAVRKWDLSKFETQSTNTITNGKFNSSTAERIYRDSLNL